MNKRAEEGEGPIYYNVIFFVLLAIAFGGYLFYISNQANGAAAWEDYYAKEIVRMINYARPGDNIAIDVQKATEIARKNNVPSFSEIFSFDNINNEVCVKLSLRKKSCYAYFNNVDIIDSEIKLGVPTNILTFNVVGVQKQT